MVVGCDHSICSRWRDVHQITLSGHRYEVTGIFSSVGRSVRPIYLVEVVIDDGTAQLPLFFFGNRRLSNMAPGWRVQVEGTLVRFRGRRCLLNPVYELPAPSGEPRGHSAGQGV